MSSLQPEFFKDQIYLINLGWPRLGSGTSNSSETHARTGPKKWSKSRTRMSLKLIKRLSQMQSQNLKFCFPRTQYCWGTKFKSTSRVFLKHRATENLWIVSTQAKKGQRFCPRQLSQLNSLTRKDSMPRSPKSANGSHQSLNRRLSKLCCKKWELTKKKMLLSLLPNATTSTLRFSIC